MRIRNIILIPIIITALIGSVFIADRLKLTGDREAGKFSSVLPDFKTTAAWAEELWLKYADDDGRLCITVFDGYADLGDTTVDISCEVSEAIKNSKGYFNYSFISVRKEYMIFWLDETGYSGILYSSSPKKVLRLLNKSSYPTLESIRISDKFYKVGHFGR